MLSCRARSLPGHIAQGLRVRSLPVVRASSQLLGMGRSYTLPFCRIPSTLPFCATPFHTLGRISQRASPGMRLSTSARLGKDIAPDKDNQGGKSASHPFSWSRDIWTIPNVMSFTRLAATPYIGYCIVTEQYDWAFGLFVASGLTDMVGSGGVRGVGYARCGTHTNMNTSLPVGRMDSEEIQHGIVCGISTGPPGGQDADDGGYGVSCLSGIDSR
jgi:hypothetical protein